MVGDYAMLDAQSLGGGCVDQRFVELHVSGGWEFDCEVRQLHESDFS